MKAQATTADQLFQVSTPYDGAPKAYRRLHAPQHRRRDRLSGCDKTDWSQTDAFNVSGMLKVEENARIVVYAPFFRFVWWLKILPEVERRAFCSSVGVWLEDMVAGWNESIQRGHEDV